MTLLLLLDPPWNIDVVVHDPVGDLWCEVEDGVFVRLDRLGGVNDKHQGGIEDLAPSPSLTETLAAGLGAVLALAADTPDTARHGWVWRPNFGHTTMHFQHKILFFLKPKEKSILSLSEKKNQLGVCVYSP